MKSTEEFVKNDQKGLGAEIRIQVNPNSTIADDIINIVHEPQKSKIKIHLRLDEKRRCKQPQLLGRLSGPFISKISWEKQLQQESIDGREMEVLTGFYKIPQTGRYFLEIFVLMCEELPFETYNGNTCLENPDQNRLTNEGAFIDITIAEQDGLSRTVIGHWYNTQEKMKHEPLYTRYQPQNCRQGGEARCKNATDLSRFDPYEFHFTYKNLTLDSIIERLKGVNEGHKVCFIGASHARVMINTAAMLLKDALLWDRVEVRYADQL
eukprot:14140699-Ditylum_brightwellii.AAC.1